MQVIFEKEKETKNKIKYNEVTSEDRGAIIGALYVEKWFAKGRTKLIVEIKEGE
jgi:hypothetical protein